MQKCTNLFCAAIFAITLPFFAGAQTIITVAGIGDAGWTGDGASPEGARVHWPTSVAIDRSGDVYIADALNNVIRKIKNGVITTIAGTGFESGTGYGGFAGDGGPATAAWLHFPSGVAVDKIGNVYITDQKNNRLRKIDTSGNISTICGDGTAAYTGDGGSAASAELSLPSRVAVDTLGNIFIADMGNNAIRKIDVTTSNISTIAGTGVGGYNGDMVPANTAQLDSPIDVAVNDSGYVYIADTYNNRIRRIDLFGTISTMAGNGIPGFAGDMGLAVNSVIYNPSGIVADDSGRVWFSQLGDSRIRKINLNDTIITLAGIDSIGYNSDYIPATSAKLWDPQGLALKPNGDIYIADEGNNRVRLITATELAVNTVSGLDAGVSIYPNPATDGAFNVMISTALDERAHIVVVNLTGEKVADVSEPTNSPFELKINYPPGLYFLSAATREGMLNEKLIVK